MQATKGDVLIVRGRTVGNVERRGEVIDVRGKGGEPPYLVRWEADGHEGLVYPGPDCSVEPGKKPAKKSPKKPAAKKSKK
jgi:hypothetical protein